MPRPLLSVGRSNTMPWEPVITASHNPGSYLGLKVKRLCGRFPEITSQIEALLPVGPEVAKPEVQKCSTWPAAKKPKLI